MTDTPSRAAIDRCDSLAACASRIAAASSGPNRFRRPRPLRSAARVSGTRVPPAVGHHERPRIVGVPPPRDRGCDDRGHQGVAVAHRRRTSEDDDSGRNHCTGSGHAPEVLSLAHFTLSALARLRSRFRRRAASPTRRGRFAARSPAVAGAPRATGIHGSLFTVPRDGRRYPLDLSAAFLHPLSPRLPQYADEQTAAATKKMTTSISPPRGAAPAPARRRPPRCGRCGRPPRARRTAGAPPPVRAPSPTASCRPAPRTPG